MKKILTYICISFNLSLLFSGRAWKNLDQDQCDQLITIIKNFDSDPNIKATVIRFAWDNHLFSHKKITTSFALSSKKNFIKTLKTLCRDNKTFINALKSCYSGKSCYKDLTIDKSPTFSITLRPIMDISSKQPIEAIFSSTNIKAVFDLATNVHDQLVYHHKKEVEIAFKQQYINHLLQIAEDIKFYKISNQKQDTYTNIQQLLFANKIWKDRFVFIILNNKVLQYYFDLTYCLANFMDKISQSSSGNNTLILSKAIESILDNETPEIISIHNLLLVNLLSNVILVLNIFSPSVFSEFQTNATPYLTDLSLQSDYWDQLPPIK